MCVCVCVCVRVCVYGCTWGKSEGAASVQRTSFSRPVGLISLWQSAETRGKVRSYESRLMTPISELQNAN
jgi:hypothetical protein